MNSWKIILFVIGVVAVVMLELEDELWRYLHDNKLNMYFILKYTVLIILFFYIIVY